MLIEGLITVFVVEFVKQLRPEMLGSFSEASRH